MNDILCEICGRELGDADIFCIDGAHWFHSACYHQEFPATPVEGSEIDDPPITPIDDEDCYIPIDP